MVESVPASKLIEQARAAGTYIEKLSARAYWGSRDATPKAIAKAVFRTIEGLQQLSIAPGPTWWNGDDPLPTDLAMLSDVIEKGISRRDSDGGRVEGTGYVLHCYNGERRKARGATLRISAGSTSPYLTNAVVVSPAKGQAEKARFTTAAAGLVTLLAENWNPDWALFTRTDLEDKVKGTDRYPGAVTWLADHLGQVPKELDAAVTRHVADGTLIDLMHDSQLPEAARLLEVRDGLADAGLVMK